MPKVSEEYFDNKRKIILDAALKVFYKKPAYTVSMKDIVRESKLSQGGVYKYYSNIDDIIISLINRNEIKINPKDIIKENYDNPEKAVFELLKEFKNYFFEIKKVYGKIFFELFPIFLNNKKRLNKYAGKINSDLEPNRWFKELFNYLDKKIKEGYFNPIIDSLDIYMQIVNTLDGIGKELILRRYYGLENKIFNNKGEYQKNFEMKLDNFIETLYKTTLFLLGSKNLNEKIKRKKREKNKNGTKK